RVAPSLPVKGSPLFSSHVMLFSRPASPRPSPASSGLISWRRLAPPRLSCSLLMHGEFYEQSYLISKRSRPLRPIQFRRKIFLQRRPFFRPLGRYHNLLRPLFDHKQLELSIGGNRIRYPLEHPWRPLL